VIGVDSVWNDIEGSDRDGNSPKRHHGWCWTRRIPWSMFRVRGGGDGWAVALKSITGFWFLGRSVAAMKATTCECCVRCFLRKWWTGWVPNVTDHDSVTHVSCCVVDKYVMWKLEVRILTVTRGKLSWVRSCSVMRVLEFRKPVDWITPRVN